MPHFATLLTASLLHAWPIGLVQEVEAFTPTGDDARVAHLAPRTVLPAGQNQWRSAGATVATSLRHWVGRGADGAWELSFDHTLLQTGRVDWVGYVSARRPGDRTIGRDALLALRVPAGLRFDAPDTRFDPVFEVATTVRSIDAPFAGTPLYDATLGVRWTP